MPSKKKPNKSQKSKKKPAPQRQKKPTMKMTRSLPMSAVHAVCGLTDPFCAHADGAKWPDGSNNKSLTYSQHFYSPAIGTDSSGYGCVLFCPAFNYFYAQPLTTASGVYTFTQLQAGGTQLTAVNAYRIVSWGLTFRRTTSNMLTTGLLHVRHLQLTTGTSFASGVTGSTFNCALAQDIPLVDAGNVQVVGRRSSDSNPFIAPFVANPDIDVNSWFADAAGSTANNTLSPYLPIILSVTGGVPSTNVGTIEVIVHYELTFTQNNNNSLLATPPVPKAAPIITASTRVLSSLSPAIWRNVENVGTTITNYATKALLAGIGGYFGGPAGARGGLMLGNAMDVD